VFAPHLLAWRQVKNWRCLGCGDCCRRSVVMVSRGEASKFLQKYPWSLESLGAKSIIKHNPWGRCVFQVGNLCSIQHDKPLACRLWPFHPRLKPLRTEDAGEAEYSHQGQRYYIYVDRRCVGLGKGPPITLALAEVVRMVEGIPTQPKYTTIPLQLL